MVSVMDPVRCQVIVCTTIVSLMKIGPSETTIKEFSTNTINQKCYLWKICMFYRLGRRRFQQPRSGDPKPWSFGGRWRDPHQRLRTARVWAVSWSIWLTTTSICNIWHQKCIQKNNARWHPKSPASQLFAQPFVQARIKKVPHHCPLWGEFSGDRWIPHTKGR